MTPICTILCIGIPARDRQRFARWLARDGGRRYTWLAAETVAQALDLCAAEQPDCLLVNDRATLDDLMSRGRSLRCGVVLITEPRDEAAALAALGHGAHDYIVRGRTSQTGAARAIVNAIEKARLHQPVPQPAVAMMHETSGGETAELALQESEARFRATFEQAAVGMAHVAIDGSWLRVNQRLCEIVGYTHAELLQRTFQDITHPDDLARDLAYAQQLLAGAIASYGMDKRYIRKDGLVVWIRLTVSLVRDPAGAPRYFISVVEDITDQQRAEDALRQREREFKTLVENAPDIIVRFDRALRHVYVSSAVERATGLPPALFVGKTNREIGMPDHLCDIWDRGLLDVFASGHPRSLEFMTQLPDGDRHYQSLLVPERNDAGEIETVLSIVRDVTEQYQAEAALRFLADASNVLGSSLDYESTLESVARLAVPFLADICTVDLLQPNGSLRRVAMTHADPSREPALRELSQRYPPTRSPQSPLWQAIQSERSILLTEIPESLVLTFAQDDEHRRLIQATGPHRSSMVVPLVARERIMGIISFGRILPAAPFDEQMLQLAEELARRAAMAIDNARLYRESQEAIQEREAFLSIASHEINNPLTTLLGHATLLQRRIRRAGHATEREQHDIQTVIDQARRISTLLRNLLDLSRIDGEQFKIQRQPLDLAQIVQRVVAEARPMLTRHAIRVHADGSPVIIQGDPLRLEQVFSNLLSNAIKYSPDGGTITITLDATGDVACVTIADQGIGIPAEAVPLLFRRFYRVRHAGLPDADGSGIGLYVVKEIVMRHAGAVEVASSEGVGSTFTVRLPLASQY